MKQLSIEQKAQRFDEAIKKAKKWYNANTNEGYRGIFKEIFPELKESEDEKIRKAIIQFFELQDDNTTYSFIPKKDIIAWLEKQGEQKPADKFHEGEWVVRGKTIAQILDIQEQYYVGLDINGKDFTSSRFLSDDKIHLWTIQDAKDGDVLSYRDGQWIFILKRIIDKDSFEYYTLLSTIHNDLTINDSAFSLLINSIYPATKEQCSLLFQKMKEAGYEWDAEKKKLKKIEQKSVDIPKDFEKYVEHLLSLSDGEGHGSPAKVKEVSSELLRLVNRQKIVWSEEDKNNYQILQKIICDSDITAKMANKLSDWFKSLKDRITLLPIEEVLTKVGLKPYKDGDQWCILLGDNIQEGICGFGNTVEDALYAFLKDLITSQSEQKPAWSKEDEEIHRKCICAMRASACGFPEEEKFVEQVNNWLISLKNRYIWKPSDVQMDAIKDAIDYLGENTKIVRKHLISLYDQLKKLKE